MRTTTWQWMFLLWMDRWIASLVWLARFYLGLSPWQFYVVRDYDYGAGQLKTLAGKASRLVAPSTQTNHLEINIKPSANGSVDVYFSINSNPVYVLYSQAAVASRVGVGMSFHSVAVAYDNFEYEEIEP
jgi:hypothetical protein